VGSIHTAYFVLVEIRAIFKSRSGPDFDEKMRLRPFNPAILSGATDIIAVRHADGSLRHSAFHVRFGWFSGVFRGGDFVTVFVDGIQMRQRMIIASNGTAYFASESEEIALVRHALEPKKDQKDQKVNVRFVPVITLCGKNITKFMSLFVTVEVQTQVHVWQHSDRVVISDIDGTITSSDAAGHILYWAQKWKLPILSAKDFTHPNVVDLLAAVSNRNYKIMYLTARNIGYAQQVTIPVRVLPSTPSNFFLFLQTKAYIHGLQLPGPVVTSHSGLVAALWLEILLKRPDEFKIEELSSIRNLFRLQGHAAGFDHEPFFAGLGNRDTDTKSYQKVGEGCMLAMAVVLQFTMAR
jgi:phosphatidate phosphatase PAH1